MWSKGPCDCLSQEVMAGPHWITKGPGETKRQTYATSHAGLPWCWHIFPSVTYLFVTVNFMGQLTGSQDVRYLAKHCIWACQWAHFWMKLAFAMVDSGEQCALHNAGGPSSNPLRTWTEQKGRRKQNLAFPASFFELGCGQLQLLVLRSLDLDWPAPPAFLDSSL